jgi:hypothetical protein
LSAELVALVPTGVVTVTSTVLAPVGELTVIELDDTTDTPVPGVEPNMTEVAALNPVPVTVTEVPPAGRPATGLTAKTVGTASKVKLSLTEVALVAQGVVTVTSTVAAASAGETAVTWVAEVTV